MAGFRTHVGGGRPRGGSPATNDGYMLSSGKRKIGPAVWFIVRCPKCKDLVCVQYVRTTHEFRNKEGFSIRDPKVGAWRVDPARIPKGKKKPRPDFPLYGNQTQSPEGTVLVEDEPGVIVNPKNMGASVNKLIADAGAPPGTESMLVTSEFQTYFICIKPAFSVVRMFKWKYAYLAHKSRKSITVAGSATNGFLLGGGITSE